MPKLTLLEMTQKILSSMDSDEVNSITDTTESLQVVDLLETTYYEILDLRDRWDHLGGLGVLTASGDADKPTHMTLPSNINNVEWVKYNKITDAADDDTYTDIEYKCPKDFMALLASRTSSDSDIKQVVDDSGVILLIRTDQNPQYYTSFDDQVLVFDSYYLALDTTMQGSKTQYYGYTYPVFTISDGFIPNLPAKVFSYYLAEATSVCFNNIKQQANAKEEQKSRRQRYQISREKRVNQGGGIRYPNYGRKQ